MISGRNYLATARVWIELCPVVCANAFDQAPSLDRHIESNGLAWPSNNIQHITSDHDIEKLSQRLGSLRIILGPDSHRLGSKQLFRSSPLDGEEELESTTNLHRSRNIILELTRISSDCSLQDFVKTKSVLSLRSEVALELLLYSLS